MVVKVYYSEISGSKEVKKRQQRVMMILDSKQIPYEAIDITEPGKEGDKEFMLSNAKPRGDSKYILSPQIFSDALYCGDYDDFELANENDVLEQFLNTPKIESNNTNGKAENGTIAGSREGSAEADAKAQVTTINDSGTENPEPVTSSTTSEAESVPPPQPSETETLPTPVTEVRDNEGASEAVPADEEDKSQADQ